MATNPNLPGCDEAPATSTPRGSNRAWNCSGVGVGRPADGRRRRSASPSSTSASTAIGAPVGDDDQRVDVDAVDVGPLGGDAARARRGSRPARPGRRAPRRGTRSSRRWVASWSIISWAVTVSTGAGRNTTSATASARMPPTPSITVGPNCGSRSTPAISSRLPRIIGATSTTTSPSSGVAAASSSVGGPAHGGGVGEAEADEPALGLVGDGVAVELGHDRVARARRPRRPRRRAWRPAARRPSGRRSSASSALDSDSDSVRVAIGPPPYRVDPTARIRRRSGRCTASRSALERTGSTEAVTGRTSGGQPRAATAERE